MADLTKINLDTLKVGDVVGVPRYISYGWCKHFRDPYVSKETITHITPKRTKFITEKGEYTTNGDKQAHKFVEYNDEAIRSNKSASLFNKIQSLEYQFELAKRKGKFDLANLSDDDLAEVESLMNRISSKYIKEDE